MRKALLLVWLMLPVLVGAYHYGPGQQRMILDDVSRVLSAADRQAARGQWADAERLYEEALERLPSDRIDEQRRIRLERAKAQMLVSKLPEAHQELKQLVDELQAAATADRQLLSAARTSLANSQYYMTWLMRLEGRAKDNWEPEIESARQTFRLLAQESAQRGDTATARQNREDLESTIRLVRMDLSDLQGLPLPTQ